jgi:hypothetical protein
VYKLPYPNIYTTSYIWIPYGWSLTNETKRGDEAETGDETETDDEAEMGGEAAAHYLGTERTHVE